jgi:hypothetical protein
MNTKINDVKETNRRNRQGKEKSLLRIQYTPQKAAILEYFLVSAS